MKWNLPAVAITLLAAVVQGMDLTFLATSDPQCSEERAVSIRATIAEMNEITARRWPAAFGAEPVGCPRGVVVLGDLVEKTGRAVEWNRFAGDFGLDGTDGLLKYPVFEGWGNHDGPAEREQIKKRNQVRLERKLIQHISQNGLHYSWDWDGVHFVQLNLYPGIHAEGRNDPMDSLDFLKTDLATQVGDSGRPVVLLHHYDLQNFKWWRAEEIRAYRDAIQPYRILLICHGHSGLGVYTWNGYDVINTGQTENGFFAVRITDRRLQLAYRARPSGTWSLHLMLNAKRVSDQWWQPVGLSSWKALARHAIRS